MISQHQEFILSSVSDILSEAADIIRILEDNMLLEKSCEYVLQTVFLKMTGFLEQKMKCICWEIATECYEYRQMEFLKNRNVGFSTYMQKKDVLNDLMGEIRKIDPMYDFGQLQKSQIVTRMTDDISEFYKIARLDRVYSRQYEKVRMFMSRIKYDNILTRAAKGKIGLWEFFHGQLTGDNLTLFEKNGGLNLQHAYATIVYRHRNRCAHNTICYQRNNPPIEFLSSPDFAYHNYLVRFAILDLIDVIIVHVYAIWREKCLFAYGH